MAGQSVMDRVIAAKHSISGAGLAKSVCKATTEEIIGPKKKHLDYLVHCTNEPNVSIPQMADLLIERTQHNNWVVVFKSLISIHNLMNYGNERFSQYFASNNCSFNLGTFVDKSLHGYDMSTFVRRYSKYLNAKSLSYRTMAYDFCKVKRGKDDGLLRTMNAEKLLKSLPPLQQQLDGLMEFDCTPNELTNGVMNACFMLLFKDLIRLFACYNDGIINLLEKYFDMNKKQCKDALEIYKRFLVRMEKVSEFLKVAENVGIDKGDIPDLAKAPSSLLTALEEHYEFLENKKGTAPVKPAGFTSALNSMTSASNIPISDEDKNRILIEENKQFEEFKKHKDLTTPVTSPASTNPFLTSPTSQTAVPTNNIDLFGSPIDQGLTNGTRGTASDDLLSLNTNPFQQNIENVMSQTNAAQPAFGASPWGNDLSSNTFASDNSFAAAFGSTQVNGVHAALATDSDANEPSAETLDITTATLTHKSPFSTSRSTSPAPNIDVSLFGVTPELRGPSPNPEIEESGFNVVEPEGPPPPVPARVMPTPSPVRPRPVTPEPEPVANLLDMSMRSSPRPEQSSNVSLLEGFGDTMAGGIGGPPGAGMASSLGGNYGGGLGSGVVGGAGYGYDSGGVMGGGLMGSGSGGGMGQQSMMGGSFTGQQGMFGEMGGQMSGLQMGGQQQIGGQQMGGQMGGQQIGGQAGMGGQMGQQMGMMDQGQGMAYMPTGVAGSQPMGIPGSPMRAPGMAAGMAGSPAMGSPGMGSPMAGGMGMGASQAMGSPAMGSPAMVGMGGAVGIGGSSGMGSPAMSASPAMSGSPVNMPPMMQQGFAPGVHAAASPMKASPARGAMMQDGGGGGGGMMGMANQPGYNTMAGGGGGGIQTVPMGYGAQGHSIMSSGEGYAGYGVGGQNVQPPAKPDPLEGIEGFDSFGDVLRPQAKVTTEKKETRKLIASDLDTSMMQLAGSLHIKGGDQIKKTEHQWQPKNDQRLTGGTNWQQPLTSGATWSSQTPYNQQAMMGGAPRMQYSNTGMTGIGGPTPYMGMNTGAMMPNTMVPGAPPMHGYNQPMMGAFPQQPRMPVQTQANDPFGSL